MTKEWVAPDVFGDLVRLDKDRKSRRGFSEAILTASKSNDQLLKIINQIRNENTATIFTKVELSQSQTLLDLLPEGTWHSEARIFTFPKGQPVTSQKQILVLTAGSSDFPIGMESLVTAEFLGRNVRIITDIGVAGLARLLTHLEIIRRADVIIVVAGMDGALPGVVAGLVQCPVIAIPTSVGYGASFEGLAALLTMLNACAPGVAVVNIDNGYGAGYIAAQITN